VWNDDGASPAFGTETIYLLLVVIDSMSAFFAGDAVGVAP